MRRPGWRRVTGTLVVAAAVFAAGWAVAQRRGGGRGWGGGGRGRGQNQIPEYTRGGIPEWDLDPEVPSDVFTFVRLRYTSWGRQGWTTDYPASDINLSFRLQQLTSLKVNPTPKVLDITDPALRDYPFVYMVEPGGLQLSDAEVKTLREYLLGGGFLMVDDFWGNNEWDGFYEQIKRVFPDREIQDLDIKHPIFHSVFDLKQKPQMPSIDNALQGRSQGITWERGEEGREVHYRAFFDDKGRMVALICHNTDLGDGWEREGEDRWYFETFSEKMAYPMAINVIFYVMSH